MKPERLRSRQEAFEQMKGPDLWRDTGMGSQNKEESRKGWEGLPDPGNARKT